MKRNRSKINIVLTTIGAAILMAAQFGCGNREDLTKVPPVSAHPQVPTPNLNKPPWHKPGPLTKNGPPAGVPL
jgi:hypothetical protein